MSKSLSVPICPQEKSKFLNESSKSSLIWSLPLIQSLLSAFPPQTFCSSHVHLQEISQMYILSLISVLVYDLPKLETLPSKPNPTLILNRKRCNPSPTKTANQSDSAFILQTWVVPSNSLTLPLLLLSLLRVNSLKSSEKSSTPQRDWPLGMHSKGCA